MNVEHVVCGTCRKIGHAPDMIALPGWAVEEYKHASSSCPEYEPYSDNPTKLPDVWFHVECAPLRARDGYGGFELTGLGKKNVERARAHMAIRGGVS